MAHVSVNIVSMDNYMNPPMKNLDPYMSDFRSTSIERVPIIRIFGSTYEGVKACVHIHGIFPYFYVHCDKDIDNPETIAYQLAAAVDKAINITLNQATSSQQHIYKITLEEGIPFYGYHSKKQSFFKISFYNPNMIKKASTILQSGNVMGTVFQPYESHIPYKQQFMIDFNLFGMNFVRFAKPLYRCDIQIRKQSVCPLEFDILAEDILNQYEIIPRNVACNPGIQYIRDEEMKREGGETKKGKVESNLTQNRINVEPTSTDKNYREKLRALLKSKKPRSSQSSDITSQNDSLSTTLLDISLLDITQLEDHADLFMQLLNENQENIDEEVDDDCILSQKKELVDEDNDELDMNTTLIDYMSSLDMREFNDNFEEETLK